MRNSSKIPFRLADKLLLSAKDEIERAKKALMGSDFVGTIRSLNLCSELLQKQLHCIINKSTDIKGIGHDITKIIPLSTDVINDTYSSDEARLNRDFQTVMKTLPLSNNKLMENPDVAAFIKDSENLSFNEFMERAHKEIWKKGYSKHTPDVKKVFSKDMDGTVIKEHIDSLSEYLNSFNVSLPPEFRIYTKSNTKLPRLASVGYNLKKRLDRYTWERIHYLNPLDEFRQGRLCEIDGQPFRYNLPHALIHSELLMSMYMELAILLQSHQQSTRYPDHLSNYPLAPVEVYSGNHPLVQQLSILVEYSEHAVYFSEIFFKINREADRLKEEVEAEMYKN